MNKAIVAGLLFGATISVGCGPTCQSTCTRLYGNTGDSCGITRPGTSQTKLINVCMETCNGAMEYPGELEGYDPDERPVGGSSSAIELKNDKQAAVWMDCISETACEDLSTGYCAPVW